MTNWALTIFDKPKGASQMPRSIQSLDRSEHAEIR